MERCRRLGGALRVFGEERTLISESLSFRRERRRLIIPPRHDILRRQLRSLSNKGKRKLLTIFFLCLLLLVGELKVLLRTRKAKKYISIYCVSGMPSGFEYRNLGGKKVADL